MFNVQYYYISLSSFLTLDQGDAGEEFEVFLDKKYLKILFRFSLLYIKELQKGAS